MKFNSIRIVLVATSHAGNIGSTARAMKTMGFTRLYLVSPLATVTDHKATELAAGADDVLQNAIITSSLQEALQGCHLIFATSARPREIALPGHLPVTCAAQIAAANDKTEVAIVFGRERTGLTNQELLQCHYHVHIPTVADFSSLNLSQSVQIMAYELRMALSTPSAEVLTRQDSLATHEDVERFHTHLKEVLTAIDFLHPTHPKRLLQRLRRLFNRVQLEAMEVNLLRGILTQIQRAMRINFHD